VENIYIINDGHIPVENICKMFKNISDYIIILKTNEIGPAAARNEALQLINCKYIAFLDDDSYPLPNWLSECEKLFEENPTITAQLGRILWAREDKSIYFFKSFIPKFRQKIYDYRHQVYQSDRFINELINLVKPTVRLNIKGLSNHISGGNFAIKNSFFAEHGWFNLKYLTYHDKELAYRILINNGIIAYNPEMKVLHKHSSSIIRAIKRAAFTVQFKLILQKEYKSYKWTSISIKRINSTKLKLSPAEFAFNILLIIIETLTLLYLKLKTRND